MQAITIYSKISSFLDVFTDGMIKKIVKLFDGNKSVRLIDLLLYLPAKYVQYIDSDDVSVGLNNSDVSVFVKIIQHGKPLHFKGGKTPYSISVLTKNDTKIVLKFFRYNTAYLDKFEIGKVIKIRGKLTMYKGSFVIVHPSLLEILNDFPINSGKINDELVPVYRLKEGVSKADILKIIDIAVNLVSMKNFDFPVLKQDINCSLTLKDCFQELYKPKSQEGVSRALSILAFEEFVASFFAIEFARRENICPKLEKVKIKIDQKKKDILLQNFGYELTDDQKSAISSVEKYQESGDKFFVLIQGDVGSGKTIVALILALNVALTGKKILFLAPTTILASQHFKLSAKLLEGLSISCELLTSRVGALKRRKILKDFHDGETKILFGTHSLLSDEIDGLDVGLIVIDEQHRFGVNQRVKIVEKSKDASVLMLSATPIPRSLAMGMYGDIDILKIFQKPSFQKPIITSVLDIEKYDKLLSHIEAKIEDGDRVYWICHLIDSEEDEKIGVLKRFDRICEKIDKSKIAFLHGKIKEDEKNAIIEKFQSGEVLILISTTVVEVGVNVPEATIIVIENANMFGLAQLHQLRGRVGRGEKQSYCVLLYDQKNGECDRLGVIKDNLDGFEIAKKDMKMRGIGNILGKEQSGDIGYKIANISRDFDVMKDAMDFAKDALKMKKLENDPEFFAQIERLLKTFFPYDYERFLNG